MSRSRLTRGTAAVAGAALAAVAALAAAGAPAQAGVLSAAPAAAPAAGTLPKLPTAPVVRIGFFANVTHAPALVAQQLRLFETFLGKDGTKVQYVAFIAGPAAIEAMKGGAIDVSYIGPNPTVSGFVSTNGSLLRVVSGVTSGGAQLVVKPGIRSVSDLKGTTLATPQLGNTQDVALRSWLLEHGLKTSLTGTGDVTVAPADNSTTLTLFRKGDIQGAWLPEPWSSRLVLQGGAKVLVDEKSLWPKGQFVTTNLIASQAFLNTYPGTVRSIIQANNAAITFLQRNPARAKGLVQQQIAKWTGNPLPEAVVTRAMGNLQFTWNPLPATLAKSADDAVTAGLLRLGPNKLAGIYDLRLLNQALRVSGTAPVSADGLGAQ
jgi:NitT/TauT family transport system substrate-binding protein